MPVHTTVPKPITHGQFLVHPNGRHIVLTVPHFGDRFDLSSGECHVARMVDGVRYDTDRSILVAGNSTTGAADSFRLAQIYRGDDGRWFLVRMQWWGGIGFRDERFIEPVPDAEVLYDVGSIIPRQSLRTFLLDWYCAGWVPRNDDFVRSWAEDALSADDCHAVLEAMAALPCLT